MHNNNAAAVSLWLLILSCFFLAGCTPVARDGDYQFDISAADSHASTWSLPKVASAGRIELDGKFHEETSDQQVATLELSFNDRPEHMPATLSITDQACDGWYELELEYNTSFTVAADEYFEVGMAWGKPLHLVIEWSRDGSLRIEVNGKEEKRVKLYYPMKLLALTIKKGGLKVSRLSYVSLP